MTQNFITALMILNFALAGFAQEMPPQPVALVPDLDPKLVIKQGESIKLIIDQDREATLYMSHVEPYQIEFKVDLAENLCVDEYTTPACKYSLDFALDHIVFLWSKHPDANKIGKTVTSVQTYAGSPPTMFKSEIDFRTENKTFASRFIGASQLSQFRPDEIKCDNWDWLGEGIQKDTKKSYVKFYSWASENMIMNLETKVNENRTLSAAEDVVFDFAAQSLKLNSIAKFASASQTLPILTLGSISTLQLQKKTGESCQISLAHDVRSAVGALDLDAHYKSKPNFQIYANSKSTSFKLFLRQASTFWQKNSSSTKLEFE